MSQYELRLDELIKANQRLKEALALPKNDVIRDSVIQRFEFTVELSWKILAKTLKASGLSETLSPKALVREAARLGWIADPEKWIHFIDQRNLSSHTYREALAEEVYKTATELPRFADALIAQLRVALKDS